MWLDKLPRKFTLLISVLMIALGMLLGVWVMIQLMAGIRFTESGTSVSAPQPQVAETPPTDRGAYSISANNSSDLNHNDSAGADPTVVITTATKPTATNTTTPPRLTVQIDTALGDSFRQKLNQLALTHINLITETISSDQLNHNSVN